MRIKNMRNNLVLKMARKNRSFKTEILLATNRKEGNSIHKYK